MKKINVKDFELSKVQENAAQAFDSLPTDFPIMAGKGGFVSATIGTSDTQVNHGLGRNIEGWLVVRKQGQGDVWESATVNPLPASQVILKASLAVAVTIYFF